MSDESEYATRQKRIDPKLKDAGWTVVAFNPSKSLANYSAHAIKEYPTKNGPADYVLVAQGKLIAAEHTLATAEGRPYEPASALLARIQAERQSPTEQSPKNRKRQSVQK